jgi:hypothetical protein
MKRVNFFSSGGVGDTLIVGLKIQQFINNLKDDVRASWYHFEKHECHELPIRQIMDRMLAYPGRKYVNIVDKPEKSALEMCKILNGVYLNTKIIEMDHPYFNHYTEKYPQICVQMHGGRMHDNTRREVSLDVVQELHEKFPSKYVLLIGPERVDVEEKWIVNRTARTPCITEAFQSINESFLFVGPDGIFAYYAAMKGKPCVINYHIPTLMQHYWHPKWADHVIPVFSGNKLSSLPANLQQMLYKR